MKLMRKIWSCDFYVVAARQSVLAVFGINKCEGKKVNAVISLEQRFVVAL